MEQILAEHSTPTTILWTIVTGVSILTALILSIIAWKEIIQIPTETLADMPNYPIWNYPFPAITICNFNVISKTKAFEVAQKLKKPHNVTVNEMARNLRLLHYLTDVVIPETSYEKLDKVQRILDENNVAADKLLQRLSPDCEKMLQKCNWKGQQIACKNLFNQIKTPAGFCCSFNYFALKNVSSFRDGKLNYKAPKRVSASGYLTALEVVINILVEDYFATPFPSYGHSMMVHYPYNFPEGNSLFVLQSVRGISFVSIKPILHRTDALVAHLDVSERNCLFPNERELKYFRYSYHNCLGECRGNIAKMICGCVPFYYNYATDNNDSTRICNLRDMQCLMQNKRSIQSSLPGLSDVGSYNWKESKSVCSCLADCNYCYYTIEGSAGEFTKEYAAYRPYLYKGVKLVNQSVFRVFYDDLASTRYTMSIKYYWHAILGLFGGVLGLFVGFSIFTVIETIYFFVFRPFLKLLIMYRVKTEENQKIV